MGITIPRMIIPVIPLPKLNSDEYNANKKTLALGHIYILILKEPDSECTTAANSPLRSPLCTANARESNE